MAECYQHQKPSIYDTMPHDLITIKSHANFDLILHSVHVSSANENCIPLSHKHRHRLQALNVNLYKFILNRLEVDYKSTQSKEVALPKLFHTVINPLSITPAGEVLFLGGGRGVFNPIPSLVIR